MAAGLNALNVSSGQEWYQNFQFGKFHQLDQNLTEDINRTIVVTADNRDFTVKVIGWADEPYLVAGLENVEDANFYAKAYFSDTDPLEAALIQVENDNLTGYSVISKAWLGPTSTLVLIESGLTGTTGTTKTLAEVEADSITIFAVVGAKDTNTNYHISTQLWNAVTNTLLLNVSTDDPFNSGWVYDNGSATLVHYMANASRDNAYASVEGYTWITQFTEGVINWLQSPDTALAQPCYSWAEFESLRQSDSSESTENEEEEYSLTVSTDKRIYTWGSKVKVSGWLSGDDIEDEIITVYFESTSVGSTTTNGSGYYSLTFQLPTGSGLAVKIVKAKHIVSGTVDSTFITLKNAETETWWDVIPEDWSDIGVSIWSIITGIPGSFLLILGILGFAIRALQKLRWWLIAGGILLLFLMFVGLI